MENQSKFPTESIIDENGSVKEIFFKPTESDKIDIVRYKMPKVEIYEIDSKALHIFSKGGTGNNYQTAAWSCLGFSFAVLLAILTCEIKLDNGILIFSILGTALFVASIFCFVFWHNTKTEIEIIIKEIKERTKNA